MAVGDPRLSVPRGWRCSTDDRGGLTARAGTAASSGVRPTLTLVSRRVDAPRREWEANRLRDLAHARPGFDLEDHDDFDLAGHDVTYRRYSHRADGADLLLRGVDLAGRRPRAGAHRRGRPGGLRGLLRRLRGGRGDRRPGGLTSPGTYVELRFRPSDEDGTPHALMGMWNIVTLH